MLVGNGVVRHVAFTYKEIIKATVAFKNIDGDIKVVGIIGNIGINPTLVFWTCIPTWSSSIILCCDIDFILQSLYSSWQQN